MILSAPFLMDVQS